MSGVDLYTVKELMGHKTIEITMRYAHSAPNYGSLPENLEFTSYVLFLGQNLFPIKSNKHDRIVLKQRRNAF